MKKLIWLLPLILVGCSCSIETNSSASTTQHENKEPKRTIVYDVACYSGGVAVLERTLSNRPRGGDYWYWKDPETDAIIETTTGMGCISVPRALEPKVLEDQFTTEYNQEIIINP